MLILDCHRIYNQKFPSELGGGHIPAMHQQKGSRKLIFMQLSFIIYNRKETVRKRDKYYIIRNLEIKI